jgi:hypothetical protein
MRRTRRKEAKEAIIIQPWQFHGDTVTLDATVPEPRRSGLIQVRDATQ